MKFFFEEAAEAKLAIAAAMDMVIAAGVKADRRFLQQALKSSPAADTSGLQFHCYYWTHKSSISHNRKDCTRKDVGHKDDETEKRKLDGHVELGTSLKGHGVAQRRYRQKK